MHVKEHGLQKEDDAKVFWLNLRGIGAATYERFVYYDAVEVRVERFSNEYKADLGNALIT